MKSTSGPALYRIRVRGCIAPRWEQWLDGMRIEPGMQPDETALTGCLVDQAALLGLLQKLANLGLTLLEVAVDEGPAQESAPEDQEGAL
jgi:hypothetical protein